MERLSSEDRRVWMLIGGIALIAVLFVPFSQWALGVNYTYTLRVVALGGALLGIVSGVLGSFAVLRRQSLMGDALSHAALPGVAIAFLLVGRELGLLLIGAGIASWLGVQFIRIVTDTTRIKQDTAMGIVLAAWFAAGIALLAYIQSRSDASQAGLDSFIFGQAAAIVQKDVILISSVGAFSLGVLVLFWKEFKLITFDPEFAHANGFRTTILNMMLSTLIVVAIVLGLQLAGVILMVGMLIAPGIAARQWTNKLDQMVILAAIFGAFAGGTGAILSAVEANLPTGPMIIVVAFLLVLLSILFAPGRGLIWSTLRDRRDRRRFAVTNVLRDLYHYAQDHGSPDLPVPAAFVLGVSDDARTGLAQLENRGWARPQGDGWQLTAAGVEAAREDAANRQLWAVYREYSEELHLPMVAENRQADIHDLLPGQAIEKLERKLKEVST
jgi:manganese/zinc/iron transport system permease protein